MHPPSRARRTLLWTGAALSLLIVAVWTAGMWRYKRIIATVCSTNPLDDLDDNIILLLLVLLPIAIPTAWLWHRDRRRIRPGLCSRCGYDLTGNTSGVCSECGDRVATAPNQSS